ncbi:4'-phosphopantetheinyl transferase [Streptomyces sp. NPDC048650]|uniref:4'-phosphopantetheinyl transferase family protein n=1 Tax=unclassified Streptomyces TaxID=2593676 RepID=UPI0037141C31
MTPSRTGDRPIQGTGMMADVLPSTTMAVECFEDPVTDFELAPEEERVVGRAVGRRRREFTTARLCARRALTRLGLPPTPVPAGPRGEPQWPRGVVGSITHCAGYRAAAVARHTDQVAIGVDAEPNGPLPEGVLEVIALREERRLLTELAARETPVHWDRALFSAKEAVYKAWFPLAPQQLGFSDAALAFDPDRGTFSARLLRPGPLVHGERLQRLSGRWLARDGLILTAVTLHHHAAASPGPPPPAGA